MIPEQVRKLPLTKVCHPDECRSHSNCSHQGKRPVTSVEDTHRVIEIKRWLEHGGNYGVVATEDNALVIIDADCRKAIELVEEVVPTTFSVQSSPGSAHFYLKVPGYNQNRNWKAGMEEFASVRSSNWHAVGPNSVHPETGSEYRIRTDTGISVIQESLFAELESAFSEAVDSREEGAAGGGGAAPSSRQIQQTAADLQVEPTEETLATLRFINSEQKRREIAKVIDHESPPRHTRLWAGGWLYGAAGLRKRQIRRLLEKQADWATDNQEIRKEVRGLIDKTVDGRRADESVNLDQYLEPGDMGPDGSESRKTESGDDSPGTRGGENTMSTNDFDYTSKESLTVYNADSPEEAEDGERVIRAEVTNMSGHDENGEVDTDFVTISKGTLRDNGEFGVSPEFPQDNKSVGSADPDDLRLIAEALEQLADELE